MLVDFLALIIIIDGMVRVVSVIFGIIIMITSQKEFLL